MESGHGQRTITEYMKSGAREDGLKAVLAARFMHQVPMEVQLAVVADLPKDQKEAWQWFKQSPLNPVLIIQLWQRQSGRSTCSREREFAVTLYVIYQD